MSTTPQGPSAPYRLTGNSHDGYTVWYDSPNGITVRYARYADRVVAEGEHQALCDGHGLGFADRERLIDALEKAAEQICTSSTVVEGPDVEWIHTLLSELSNPIPK